MITNKANQSYIDLLVKAWRDLEMIQPNEQDKLAEWRRKWKAHSITASDLDALVRQWKEAKER